jgi:hypothetical protein
MEESEMSGSRSLKSYINKHGPGTTTATEEDEENEVGARPDESDPPASNHKGDVDYDLVGLGWIAERKDTPGAYFSWEFKRRTLLLVGSNQDELADMVEEAGCPLDSYNPVMLLRKGGPVFFRQSGQRIQ